MVRKVLRGATGKKHKFNAIFKEEAFTIQDRREMQTIPSTVLF